MNPINFLGLTSGDRSLPPLLMLADLPQRWQPRALAMKTLPGSLIFSWRGDPAAQPLLCDAGGTGDKVVLAGTQWHDLLHLHRSQLRLPVPAGAFACWGGGGGAFGSWGCRASRDGADCQVRGLEGFCPTWQFWMLLCKFFPCHSWIAEGLVGSTLITRVAASTGSSAAGGLESVWLRWLQAARLSPGMPTGLGAASSVAALTPFSFSQRRADACSSALQSFSVNLKTQKVFTATFNFRVYHSLLLLTKKQTWRSLTR